MALADIIDFSVLRRKKAIREAAARLQDELIAQFGYRTKAIVKLAEGMGVIKRFVAAVQALVDVDESVEASAARMVALEYRAAKLALDTRVVQFTRDPLGLLEIPDR